jgi:hypothetical protein
MKAGHSGARCSRPKVTGTLIRNSPIASPACALSSASASSTPSSSDFERSWKRSPSGVSDSLRVVRCNSRVPRRDSSSPTSLDTAVFDRLKVSAARTKLPVSTTVTKARISENLSMWRLSRWPGW